MMAQRLNSVTFGGMMTGGQVGNTGFLRQMKCLLRHFTTDIGINLHVDSLLEIILSCSGTPGNTSDWFCCIPKQQRCTPEGALQMITKSLQRHRLRKPSVCNDGGLSLHAIDRNTHYLTELSVVAQRWVGIQRQVIPHEVHIALQQEFKACTLHAS